MAGRKKVEKEVVPKEKKVTGRPPNDDYTDQDLIRLGDELLDWMQYVDSKCSCSIL